MRYILSAVAAATTLAFFVASPAVASGETCYPALSAKGETEHDRHEAMDEAIEAWRKAADMKHGDHFNRWYYSGDRTIGCKWNTAGTKFTCTATARPCGHDD